MTVRSARAEDLAALLELYQGFGDERASDAALARDDGEAVIAAILADPARDLLVAERDGEVLGTADLLIVLNLTHRCRPWAIVENVIVADRAQRQGVGRVLMLELLGKARAAGCYKAQLLSGLQRGGAHEFYRRLGFEPVAKGFKAYLE